MSLAAMTFGQSSQFDTYLTFRRGFEQLLDPRRYTIVWLDGQVLSGAAQVFATDSSALLTEIRTYPTGAKDIHALAAVGDVDEIVGSLTPRAEEWARAHGCIGAVVESRRGWIRALKMLGYVPFQQTVRKEL